MLSLQNFEKLIDPTILQRGKSYFNDGSIIYIEEIADRLWDAEVEGSEDYTVKIELKAKEQVDSFSCSCPYDGDVCKHIVAVLYAIREEIGNKKPLTFRETMSQCGHD